MRKDPLVSVAMAVYNGEDYLKEQVMSILSQTYSNMEIIVVDDKSCDNTLRIAKGLAEDDKRIKIFENPRNLGYVQNFLKGLSYAKGDYICFSDQDDYWLNDKIEVLRSLLEKKKENILAYSDMEICNENLVTMHKSFQKVSGIAPRKRHIGEEAFLRNIMPGCSMMFRREAVNLIKDKEVTLPLMHDHLIFILSSLLGNIVYTRKKLIKYRQHDKNNIGAFYASSVDNHKIVKKLEEAVDYFRSNIKSIKGLDLEKLESFCRCLNSGSIFRRLSFSKYYLFLRNDTLKDKFLGFFECLMPKSYAMARKMKRLPRPFGDRNDVTFSMWIMRILFTAWVFIVLFYFAKEFIAYKLVKFLGYIR